MRNYSRLAVASISLAFVAACKDASTTANARPTLRLSPVAAKADSALDAAKLVDRDGSMPVAVDRATTVTFTFGHPVELRRVKILGAEGVRVTAQGLGEFGRADAGGWTTAPVPGGGSADRITLAVTPTSPGGHLAEVEFWGAGSALAPRDPQALAQATADPKGAQYENLLVAPANVSAGTLEPGSQAGSDCLRAQFVPGAVAARGARRAYLVYQANVQRAVVLKRSLNGAAPVGGFWIVSTDQTATLVDELDPERLSGHDTVLLCLPVDATGPVKIAGLRLLLRMDDGQDLFDRDAHARLGAVVDGDLRTSQVLRGERNEIAFDRPVALESAGLRLAAVPAQLASVAAFDGKAWKDRGPRQLSRELTDIDVTDGSLHALALTFAGSGRADVPAASVAELEFSGSGTGPRIAVPRIVLTYPPLRFEGTQTIGERFGDRGYVAGWAESPAGPAAIEVDGAPAGVDGAFGQILARPSGSTGAWDTVVTARFPDGTSLSRTVRLADDRGDGAAPSGSASDDSVDRRFGKENQSAWGDLDVSRGGKVRLGSEAEIEIPDGAVAGRTLVGVTRKGPEAIPHLDPGMVNVTAPARSGYRFLPKGQKFLRAVQVTLPYDPKLLPEGVSPDQIKTYFFDPRADRWVALPRRAVSHAKGQVVSDTDHFTFMINAVMVLPDHPGPVSFNPNSIKDLKAADPSAGIDLIEAPDGNNDGTARLSMPIRLPKARGAWQPELALAYDSGAADGWAGVGWSLKTSSVQIDTRFGAPYYDGREHYALDGAQLVPWDGNDVDRSCVDGVAGRRYAARVERDFRRIVRCGTGPSDYRFEVTDRSGTLFVYGATEAGRLSSTRPTGEIGEWFLERVVDLNGNLTLYGYDLDTRESPVGFEDPTQALLEHNEPFKQLYLRSIEYSGTAPRTGAAALTDVSAPGPYRVDIRSARNGAGHLARADAMTSARFGFKVVTRRRLESIRVEVLEGAAVRGIREYRLDYQRGAFGKSRVSSISVLGAWEGYGGTGPLFHTHTLEYTDAPEGSGAKPFGGDADAVAWSFDDGADEDPISRSQGTGFGVHGYVGIGWSPSKYSGSAGVRVGYSQHESNTTSAITDVNGDGLPDRIRLRPSGVDARFNQGFDGNGGRMSQKAPFSDPFKGRTLANLPMTTLGRESGNSRNVAAQATFGPVTVDVGKSWFSNNTPEYLVDADGDGLVDVLTHGLVLFNQPRNGALVPDCVSQDPSTFCFTPAKWVRSIGAGHAAEGVTGENPADPLEDVIADADLNPSDALLEWSAPYAGNVDVSGALALVNGPGPNPDRRWDGIRLRIYRVTPTGGTPAWHTDKLVEISKSLTDAPAPIPVSVPFLDVAWGSRLYFVLSTLKNFPVQGGTPLETASFAPRITYRYACTESGCGYVSDADITTLDPSAASLYQFDATDDFKLAGAPLGALVVPDDGTLHVRSTLHKKAPSSDDVRVCIQRFAAADQIQDVSCVSPGGPGKVFETFIAGGLVRDIPIALDVPVTLADRLVFRVETDLSIDPGSVDWEIGGNLEPAGQLPPDTDPDTLAFHADAYLPMHLAVSGMATSTDLTSARPRPSPVVPFVAPEHGVLHVENVVNATSMPDAVFAARKLDGPVFKGSLAQLPPSADVELRKGEEIFFEAHGENWFPFYTVWYDAEGHPFSQVLWAVIAEFRGDSGTSYPAIVVNHTFDSVPRDDSDGDPAKFLRLRSPFGGGFHGWRYGVWGGPNDQDIDPALFDASSSLSWNQNDSDQQQADAAIAAMQDPNNADARRARQVAPLLPRRLGTFVSNRQQGLAPGIPAYVSREGTTFIAASTMHASHQQGATDASGSASAVAAFFKMGSMSKESSGDAFSGGISAGAFGLSAGISISSGNSRAKVDIRDMNGDGVIDVIRSDKEGSGSVRIADLHTLAEHRDHVDFGFKPRLRLQENTDLTVSLNMGVSAPIRGTGGALPQAQPSTFVGGGGAVGGQPGSAPPASSGGGVGSAGGTGGVVTSAGGMYGSIGGGIGINLSATKGELIDINGDGLPDAVRREPGDDRLYVRLNLGTRFADNEDVIPAGRWSRGALDALSGTIDTSATDPNMVRRTTATTVMANLGAGDENYAAGVNWESSVAATAVSFVDVNGDGLPDYVRKSAADDRMYVMLNTGYGFAPEVAWDLQAWPAGVAKPWFRTGVGRVDGLLSQVVGGRSVDAIEASGTYSEVPTVSFAYTYPILIGFFTPWLHITVGGDVTPRKISGFQLSMMDIDGDGLPDHVLKAERLDGYQNQSIYVRLNRLGGANLLKRVVRPLGGSVEIAYERQGNTVDMPGKRYVLTSVIVRDGRGGDAFGGVVVGHDFHTSYAYDGGSYDRAEREFLGFRKVTRTNPDQSVLVQSFRNENFAVKGLVEREETWSSDRRLFLRTDNEFYATSNRLDAPAADCRDTTPFFLNATDFCGSFVTHLKKTTKGHYEGTGGVGVLLSLADAPVRSSQTYEQYDFYGNVLSFLDSGDERDGRDDYRATLAYASGDTAFQLYSVSRPRNLVAADLARGTLLRKRQALYDDAGNLRRLTAHIDAAGSTAVSELFWNANGTLQKLVGPTDASGNRYTLRYERDATTQTYVTLIEDSHQYASTAEYDVRFGEATRSVDINGNQTRRVFDAFGRLEQLYGPQDPNVALMTIDYQSDRPVAFARTTNRMADGRGIDTILHVDGIKRAIQTKKTAEVATGQGSATAVGWSVSGQQLFDALGRVAAQGQPFFAAASNADFLVGAPKNPTLFEYDLLGRGKKTVEPNGAVTSVAYGFGGIGGTTRLQATASDPLGGTRSIYRDPADRIVGVKESTGTSEPVTRYVYDPLGELVSVTDAAGNRTQLAYDLMGRRTAMSNPDSGLVEFTLDAAGNVVRKVDSKLRARNASIDYVYDFDQLVAIRYPFSKPVTYEYGKAGANENGAGRVVRVADDAGQETRGYGRLGELVRSTRTVKPLRPHGRPRTFETRFAFDSYGRMLEVDYPDGEKLTYRYDAGGLLVSATGERPATRWRPQQSERYLKALTYDEFGQRRSIALGNEATTRYEYEPLTRRLHTLQTKSRGRTLQAITYSYDLVGNILGMVNALGNPVGKRSGSISYSFGYDKLYRLTSAKGMAAARRGVVDQFESTFAYSDIHNMLRNKQVRRVLEDEDEVEYPERSNHDFTYAYEGSGPHQATRIGHTLFGYDPNGNTLWECRRDEERDRERDGRARGLIQLASYERDRDDDEGSCGADDDEFRRFRWNEENRLAAVIDGEGEHVTRFIYDAAGDRVAKLGESGPSITVGQFFAVKGRKSASKHIFAGTTRLASKVAWTPEIDEDDSADFARADTSGFAREARVEGCAGGGCQVLSAHGPVLEGERDDDEFRPSTYYYHQDHLGSTGWITDETGRVHEHVEYYPYGEVWRDWHHDDEDEPRIAQRFLFTAKEFDEETGLYYYGARYYHPVFARFQSADPGLEVGLEGNVGKRAEGEGPVKLSLYAYARWSPALLIDPDGRDYEILVGGQYPGHAYGHVALRVYGQGYDKTYDFGRYGGTWGTFNSQGEGIMRVWTNFQAYIRGENATGRKTEGYVYRSTPEQDQKIMAYFASLTSNGTKRENQNVNMTAYRLRTDYDAVTNNCTTMSIDGVASADAGLAEKLRDPKESKGRGLAWYERALAPVGERVFMPQDVQANIEKNKPAETHVYQQKKKAGHQ